MSELNIDNKINILEALLYVVEKEHQEFQEENTTGWDVLENGKIWLSELKKEENNFSFIFQPVNLELAKILKKEGYKKTCEFYWQDRDLSFSISGLKKTKNGKKMNHNKYDDFIYSAPLFGEAISWIYRKNKQTLMPLSRT
jgi:hypothetical protein